MKAGIKALLQGFVTGIILAVLLTGIFLLCLSLSAHAADICFPEATAGGMVVELEQCRIQRDELSLCKDAVKNIEQQTAVQEEEILIYKSAVGDARKAADGYRALFDAQRQMYESALKEARPSVFEQAIKALGFVGAGILIGIFL